MSLATLSKSSAKEFFANERTFLHWLNVSITVGSIAAALLGVTGHVHKHWDVQYHQQAVFVRVLALLVVFTSIVVAVYAVGLHAWRSVALKCVPVYNRDRLTHGYSSTVLPMTMTVIMTIVLLCVFSGALRSYEDTDETTPPADAPAPRAFQFLTSTLNHKVTSDVTAINSLG